MIEDNDRMWHESPEYRQEQLSAALDGMLTSDEQVALDTHLAGCAACTGELAELRQVRLMLRALPEPALPRSFLLPTAGELPAPHTLARAVQSRPAAQVTPLRRPGRRDRSDSRATRMLRVTRWIGTIAAVLGLALFLGTLLPMMAHQNSAASTSAPPFSASGPATTHTAQQPGAVRASPAGTFANRGDQSADKAATATSAAAAPINGSGTVTTPQAYNAPSGPALGDILRVLALVLLFAGAAMALLSYIAARLV